MNVTTSRWGESGPRPEPDHDLDPLFAGMTATVERHVACTADDAWALVSSVERIGEFSPECMEAWWVPGFPAHAVGDRFDGSPASRWTVRIERIEGTQPGGVLLRQTFAHYPDGHSGVRVGAEADPDRAPELVASRLADLGLGMAATLDRMAAVLEQVPGSGGGT